MRPLVLLFDFLFAALVACATPPFTEPTPKVTPAPLPELNANHTPLPTSTQESQAITYPPLTSEAIESCPVTLPNDISPVGEDGSNFNLGNENGTIFTIPWPGGKIIFTPNGPGAQESDGSLGMKWPWYRAVEGDVIIAARRLDANAPPPRTVVLRGNEDGYGETGFHPSGLWFSGEGCWEVTAVIGEENLTFVTLVVRFNFDPPHFGWWPPNVPRGADTDLSGWPTAIREVDVSPTGGQIIVETRKDAEQLGEHYPDGSARSLSVNEAQAVCVRGARGENGQWISNADEVYLRWQSHGLTYRLIATGLAYGCDDLVQIAISQL